MILETLELRQFRCFQQIKLNLHPRCNVLVGGNGQGKTTILEAIYLLSRGQSFRTRLNAPLIQFDTEAFALKATSTQADEMVIQKTARSWRKIELNQKPCQRWSDLSRLLPCLVFHQDLFQIIDASAELRRRLLDWGLFYAHPEYQKLWGDCKRVLMQRNAVLKRGGSGQVLEPWNQNFVQLSLALDSLRKAYFEQMNILFINYLQDFPDLNCKLEYYNGWDRVKQNSDLMEVLIEQEHLDLKQMYTRSGPQRADIRFLTEHGRGKLEWSRGQQKIILILLKLAQAQLLARPAWILMDDLAAELDKSHLQTIYQRLTKIPGQFFLTALDGYGSDLPFFRESLWFSVNQGQISAFSSF